MCIRMAPTLCTAGAWRCGGEMPLGARGRTVRTRLQFRHYRYGGRPFPPPELQSRNVQPARAPQHPHGVCAILVTSLLRLTSLSVAEVLHGQSWQGVVNEYVSEDDSKIIKPWSIFGSGEPEGDAAKFQLMFHSTGGRATAKRRQRGVGGGNKEQDSFSIKLTNFLIPKRSNEVTKLGTTLRTSPTPHKYCCQSHPHKPRERGKKQYKRRTANERGENANAPGCNVIDVDADMDTGADVGTASGMSLQSPSRASSRRSPESFHTLHMHASWSPHVDVGFTAAMTSPARDESAEEDTGREEGQPDKIKEEDRCPSTIETPEEAAEGGGESLGVGTVVDLGSVYGTSEHSVWRCLDVDAGGSGRESSAGGDSHERQRQRRDSHSDVDGWDMDTTGGVAVGGRSGARGVWRAHRLGKGTASCQLRSLGTATSRASPPYVALRNAPWRWVNSI
ncbi:hypothetical protein B0H14DRAFT_2577533 [Mycena olivaceomarginata]|nr:hypothetical protein B0H14DRAFT_2577533 [Mycena olivaceomarginata]